MKLQKAKLWKQNFERLVLLIRDIRIWIKLKKLQMKRLIKITWIKKLSSISHMIGVSVWCFQFPNSGLAW